MPTRSRRRAERRRRPFRRLKKSEILELVAHAIELETARKVRPMHDAKIPELISGVLRQFDSAIYEPSSAKLLRVVEVQDRATPVGAQFVDAAVGKTKAVGCQQLTIVAAAGFTSGALRKIRTDTSLTVGAIELREAKSEEWPKKWETHKLRTDADAESYESELVHRRYVNALTGQVQFDILTAAVELTRVSQVFCFIMDGQTGANLRSWMMGQADPPDLLTRYLSTSLGPRLTITHHPPEEEAGPQTYTGP